MIARRRTVDVLVPGGSTARADIEAWTDRARHVRVRLEDRSREAVDDDFFKAFQLARADFEADGYRFLCYGASLGVWPSGMARDMGAGLKAYRLREDRSPSTDDLVDIFDGGEDVRPCTVAEQSQYADTWLRDAGRRDRPR